jgi:hypothetical protein
MDFDYVVLPAIILVVGVLVIWMSVRRILSLSTKSFRTWRKVVERIALSVAVLFAAFVASSSAFNAIVLYHFRATNPPPGTFYSVSGHRMHINCTGRLAHHRSGIGTGKRRAHLGRGPAGTFKDHPRLRL